MRRLILYLLVLVIVLFYVGTAGAAAAPYVGTVDSFISGATAPQATGLPARPTRTSVAGRGGITRTPTTGPVPTATAIPLKGLTGVSSPVAAAAPTPAPRATSRTMAGNKGKDTLSVKQRAALVQRLVGKRGLPRHRINFLILGSDNDQKFDRYAYPLTQVMIVLSIDPLSHTLTLLSIPRDFWVHVPGYPYNTAPDGSGTVGWSKIDTASELNFDSAACTVESNFGIPINHWVWVGLNGFIGVINRLQGVTLDVTHPVIDNNYPDDIGTNNAYGYRRIYIPPGPQHLNGDAALHFVRSRHGDVQGDFGRSSRQQILLKQLRHDLEQQDISQVVALLPSILSDLHGKVKTDASLSPLDLASYAGLFQASSHAKLNNVVLQPPYYSSLFTALDSTPQIEAEAGTGGQPYPESAVAPNWPNINIEIQRLFGGQDFSNPHCSAHTGSSAASTATATP